MLVTATLLGCAVCIGAYQLWHRVGAEHGHYSTAPQSVGLNGALIEPRR